jgi:inosine/xanthosine triphosphatase
LHVSIGTKNPAKAEGVRLAFSRFFPAIEVATIDSASVTRAQPMGLHQMTEGALARARYAISKLGGDFGVGVEAGIFEIDGSYFDHQQAAVVDASGKASLGHSAGYPLPRDPVESLLKEGKELEDWAIKLSGIDKVGDKGGLIDYLTRGAITRTQLTEQCVVTALVPWLHKDVYGL